MEHTKGERLKIHFNRKINLEFHGARLTSDGGLLAYRELEDALGIFNSASTVMSDKQTGRNIQHDMTNCCPNPYTSDSRISELFILFNSSIFKLK